MPNLRVFDHGIEKKEYEFLFLSRKGKANKICYKRKKEKEEEPYLKK